MKLLRSGQHIGNHGYNHYWWNSLNEKEMSQELDLSISFLEKIGVELDQLRQDQADYIGVEQKGPFKPEYYRY